MVITFDFFFLVALLVPVASSQVKVQVISIFSALTFALASIISLQQSLTVQAL